MNFEPMISPVNRDFQFDVVHVFVEPLRVSVHECMSALNLMDACWIYMAL